MTNEEAIVELRDLISDDRTDKENEALLMAIEALREEPLMDDDLCESCRYGDTCGQSDKGVSFAKHSKCWKYRYER